MKTTIEVHADDYLQELERIRRVMAQDQTFPEGECAICGSGENIGMHPIISRELQFSKKVPACRECSRHLNDTSIEDFFQRIRLKEHFLWNQIVAHNIRKNTWISRLAFDVLKE
ncbi:MAG: hypothetical protein ACMUHU_04400 [Thermoplasmatota archaeon]